MEKLYRSDVLRKCIVVFEAIKRAASRGNAGLEPMRGKEESFDNDCEILRVLREWLQEMEMTDKTDQLKDEINRIINKWDDKKEENAEEQEPKDWQQTIMENGVPERLTL